MAIQSTDLFIKQAENNSDLLTNGGRLTGTDATASLFPDVSGTERTAGLTRYRKVFFKNEQTLGSVATDKYPDLTLVDGKMFLESISPAEDYFTLKAGTANDTQDDADGYTGWAGTGFLETDALTNDTTLDVYMEVDGSAGELFQASGEVLIWSGDPGSPTREFITIDAGGVTWNPAGKGNNVARLTFTTTPLQNDYDRYIDSRTAEAGYFDATHIGASTASYTPDALIGKRVRIVSGTGAGQIRRIIDNTVTQVEVEYAFSPAVDATSVYEILDTMVCMCVTVGDIVSDTENVVKNGLTFDETQLKTYVIGSRDDTWTITFSDTTNFSVAGAYYGSVGSGDTSTVFRPANGASYYFEIPTAAWTGSYSGSDHIEFDTVSASKSVWLREIVPAGADPHFANNWDLSGAGDTV